jgi:cyanophycinase-like exopeptidase
MMAGAKSVYLLSGDSHHHRKTRDPLIREMLRETGRERPSVAYIGTANDDDPGFFRILKTLFERTGAGAVEMAPLAAHHADPRRARRLIETADVVFLSEGDVDLGMRVLEDHGLRADLAETMCLPCTGCDSVSHRDI